MSSQADAFKSIIYALGANAIIGVAKLFAALYTGSSTMLAEAIHSFADCLNQGLLILGIKQSKKPPNAEHPLGHGKAIYFWSFIVAVMLFSMGGLFSVYEGIHKLNAPEPATSPWLAVAVLVFSIVAESVSLFGCLREVNKVRGDLSLWRWFRESRQSELLVVLGEDIAALMGLGLALIAILMAMITGNPAFDAFGSIGIGVLLLVIAVCIGHEVKDLLVGQSAEPIIRKNIEAELENRPEVDRVLNMITLQLGNDIMVAVKARMREFPRAHEMVAAINRCEVGLREKFPEIRWIFFEPDVDD